MEFFDLIKTRRSIRRYKTQPVDKEHILKILDAANWAPSAMNQQPWEFLVISGELLKPLGNSYKSVVEEFTSKMEDNSEIISSEEFVTFAAHFGGAPVVIVVLVETNEDPREQKAYLESSSAAMENLVLAARDLGLGTCWMTGPMRDEGSLRCILDISSDKEIVAVTPLGYPDEIPNPTPRTEIKHKIKWIGW
ncbi:MAG: nitroreductase family protein [Methanobacterium sp.]|nr:nitroreductase family protein [Methanobacterium sp.]